MSDPRAEIQAASLLSVMLRGRSALWGKVLGCSDELIAMRHVQNTGELGSICLFRWEDVTDIMLAGPALEDVRRIMDPIVEESVDPDRLLQAWAASGQVVSLWDYDGSPAKMGRLSGIEDDWLVWTQYTGQGVCWGETMTPLEQVQLFEADGGVERGLAEVLNRASGGPF